MTQEKKKPEISEESAMAQVESFCKFYDIDAADMSDRMRGPHEESKNMLAKHVRKGRVEIDGAKVTHTRIDGKACTYAVIKGKHKVEMAKCGSDDHHVRLYALCASLMGLHPKAIDNFEGVDLSVVECVGTLFLQI